MKTKSRRMLSLSVALRRGEKLGGEGCFVRCDVMMTMTWAKQKNTVGVCRFCTRKTKMVIPGMTIFDFADPQIRIGEEVCDGGESGKSKRVRGEWNRDAKGWKWGEWFAMRKAEM